jgi:hypothetical protein
MHSRYLSCILLFVAAGSLSAQEDGLPHLDLVRGLRERSYHDLALSYLERLQKQPGLSVEVKSALPLELARSRSEVAATIPSGVERDRLLTTSRTELESFLKTNPATALAAEGEQALANTITEQARSLSAAADRAGAGNSNPSKAASEVQKQAMARFDEADKVFATLQKKLEDQLGIKPTPEKTPSKNANMTPSKSSPIYLSTLYYRALARYDKSRIAGLGVRDSGLANDDAKQLAEKLSQFRGISSAGWQGFALLARTLEGADDTRAAQIYRQIDAASTPNAVVAQRAIRYFPLARADASGELTDKNAERDRIKGQAERWLQLYGLTAGNSKDAQHVRFMLIRILAKELEETPENRRQTGEAQTKLDRALTLIDNMDNGRAENQDALERLKYSMLRLSGRAKGPLEAIKTFDEALLRASLEFYSQQSLEAKLKEVGNAPAKADVEAQFKTQVNNTLAALRRTQQLMGETIVNERNRVRILNMLQACLRRTNDGPRAALLCEHLAVTAKQPEVAQSAAAEALRLYQFLSRDGGKVDATANARLFAMAQFLEDKYPDSPQADEARSILGRDLIAKKQYDAAITMLTKVKSKPGVPLYLSGLASWSKHMQANKNTVKTKTADVTKALQLLQQSIDSLSKQANKDELEQRTEVQAALLILGIHDTLGDVDAVISSAQPLLKRVEEKKMPAGISAGTEMQVLETVMSAYIQKKDLQAGPAKLLAILAKRKDDPTLGDSTRFLQSTAFRIRQQLEEYQKQGDKAKPQYESTRNSFKQFLDQMEKDAKLPAKQRVWLGSSYASIGDHAKAAQILGGVKEPTGTENSKGAEADEPTMLYRQASALRINALKQMAMAEVDANDRDKGLAIVERELLKLMQQPWAKRNPTLLRDEIYLLQLRGKYSGKAGAITRWDQFRGAVSPMMAKSDGMKELYWEASYNLAYCVYMEALLLRAPEAKQKSIDRAASLIEDARRSQYGTPTQAARYRELLANPKYADLKTACDRLSQSTPKK